jgi:hypothetical protein
MSKSLERSVEDLAKTLQDAAYVGIGLGLMAFQKAQVQRRELSEALRTATGDVRATVGDNLKVVEERLRAATER